MKNKQKEWHPATEQKKNNFVNADIWSAPIILSMRIFCRHQYIVAANIFDFVYVKDDYL